MKHTILLLGATLAALPAGAADAIPKDYEYGEFTLGLIAKHVDTNSSKYLEYRDIPNGFVVPLFRLDGQKNGLRYDLFASDAREKDQRYRFGLAKNWFRLDGGYQFIPHRFGNGAKSLENNTGEGVFNISDVLQGANQAAVGALPPTGVTYPNLNKIVTPSLDAATPFDLNYQRQRGKALMTLTPGEGVTITAGYFNELRKGYRGGSGTSFGFGNVVETPDQTRYATQDVGANFEFKGSWGVAHAGFHYNWFRNQIPSLSFDNPFRVTDSTDASAYTAPGAGSRNGPSFGRVALPPDSNATIGSAGTTLKLGKKSRLFADFSYGSWTQDQTAFQPYSTNSAINTKSNPAAPFDVTNPANLPASALAGKIDVTSFNASFNSHPVDHLNFNLRYRLYDLKNKTAEVTFPGYVRFDAVWEDIGRRSVPYGYKNDRFDALVSYDFGRVTLEGGYHYKAMDRTFRETEKTTENGWNLAADFRFGQSGVLRGNYERGKRDYSGLEIERSEDASFLKAGDPANLLAVPDNSSNPNLAKIYASLACGAAPCNLRYDQAARDFDRFSGMLQLTPGDKWVFTGSYLYNKLDFKETRYGLTLDKYQTFTAEADYTPNTKWNFYLFYSWEDTKNDQRGRQSGATVSFNPLDDWTSNVQDKTNSVGAGLNLTLVPEKWTMGLFGRYQKVDGQNDIAAPPGGAPDVARASVGGVQSISAFDDTKIVALNAELVYRMAKRWSAALGGWFENYTIDDTNAIGRGIYYVPGSFFLNGDNGNYKAYWGYARLAFTW